jgi:rare lipoprotein A
MRSGQAIGRWFGALCGVLLAGVLLVGCSSTPPQSPAPGGGYKVGKPYQINGRWYYPAYDPDYTVVGVASWYGMPFHGRKTANGEIFDRHQVSAAHPTLPLPSVVRVTNLANQRQIEVRVNDRGPFVGDRIIDLSQAAARELGFERRGTTEVLVEFVGLADGHQAPREAPYVVAAVENAGQGAGARPVWRPMPGPRRYAGQPAVSAAVPPPARAEVVSVSQPLADVAEKRCLNVEYIQVGAFLEPERAVRLAKQLDAAIALPVSTDLPTVDRYARVRLGPIDDPQQAEAALRWLHQTGHGNAFLVRPGVPSSIAC